LKPVLALAAAAAVAFGCASAPESRTTSTAAAASSAAPVAAPSAAAPMAAAKTGCVPPPKDLVVKELEPGSGDSARFRTAVLVGYTGWLYDGCKPDFKGEQFDTSVGRSTPFGFMVGTGKVIKGWDEGIIGMKEKGKRLLVIPADKAYGAAGAPGGKIPPNSTLVFEVELNKIIQHAP
jgi:FKBP-type peptidyl-prolyl cis-trans isomerase FkpA